MNYAIKFLDVIITTINTLTTLRLVSSSYLRCKPIISSSLVNLNYLKNVKVGVVSRVLTVKLDSISFLLSETSMNLSLSTLIFFVP